MSTKELDLEIPASLDTLTPYYDALNRIINNKTINIPQHSRITLSNVALEAGKTSGSIKRGRPVYDALIREIKIRAKEQQNSGTPGYFQIKDAKQKAQKARADSSDFKEKYLAALGRELMLLRALEKTQKELTKGKVVSIQRAGKLLP